MARSQAGKTIINDSRQWSRGKRSRPKIGNRCKTIKKSISLNKSDRASSEEETVEHLKTLGERVLVNLKLAILQINRDSLPIGNEGFKKISRSTP